MLKNLGIGALVLTLSAGSAIASDGPCGDQGEAGTAGCTALIITLSPVASTFGLIVTSRSENREAYVSQVRDDAVEYVGFGGAVVPTALLKDAMTEIREKSPATTQMTDLEIAKVLTSSEI
jgi:hypothetical protein